MKIQETAITQSQEKKENGEINFTFFGQPAFANMSFSVSVAVNYYKNNKQKFEQNLLNFIQYSILGYTEDAEIEEVEQQIPEEREYIEEPVQDIPEEEETQPVSEQPQTSAAQEVEEDIIQDIPESDYHILPRNPEEEDIMHSTTEGLGE